MNQAVYVYADWEGLAGPTRVGVLQADQIKGREHFRFAYDPDWLQAAHVQQIDPDLALYAGEQHGAAARNFRVFLDSCPDRWGRLLMQRREAALARQQARRPRRLCEMDYLLGVHDTHRMGALRFKREPDGAFLDDNVQLAVPPLTSLAELAYAAQQIEDTRRQDDPDYMLWLHRLISPGSSLGGARPKACVSDPQGCLWIAKFPSRYDDYDIGAWEFVVYQLALRAGIQMSACRLESFGGPYHTFLTQRFDRSAQQRRHFSSALTQLGYDDGDYEASYLELAQFLTDQGAATRTDLAQLWRRMVFNIAVSNTDDHLRNHGFICEQRGWVLAPAYDINPTAAAAGLHLNISDVDNALDFDLALSVADFFQLSRQQAAQIQAEVLRSVREWRHVASQVGLSRAEQAAMATAFRV